MKEIEVAILIDFQGIKTYCFRNIVHFNKKNSQIFGLWMCGGASHDKEHGSPLIRENIRISKATVKVIRDFLNEDNNYFYFSPDHPRCEILRKTQRDTIHEFAKILNLE
ncbi:MAG: hypothetical protein WC460_06500 [Patescibacteria group bacterium]